MTFCKEKNVTEPSHVAIIIILYDDRVTLHYTISLFLSLYIWLNIYYFFSQ